MGSEGRGARRTYRGPGGAPLREAVYAVVMTIPVGMVTTYSSIARLLGTTPRAVARTLASNRSPLVVPCHRVVKSSLELGGYRYGGERVKRRLLELEGVRIVDGRVSRDHVILVDEELGFPPG